MDKPDFPSEDMNADGPDLPSENKEAGEPDIEPLRIDVSAPGADAHHVTVNSHARTTVSWTRVGKIAGLVVAVAAVTTLVANERHDAAADAADNEVVNLAVSVPPGGLEMSGDDMVSFTVQLYNAGPKELDLHAAYPSGWADPSDLGEPQSLEPHTWTAVSLEAAPDCSNDDPLRTMDVVVETGAGRREVTVDIQPYDLTQIQQRQQSACSSVDSAVYVGVDQVEVSEPQGEVLPMGLRLFVATEQGLGGAVELTGVSTSTAGLSVEGPGLPQRVGGDDVDMLDGDELDPSEATVDVEWRITNCAEAMTFADVSIELEYPAGDPDMGGPSAESLLPEGAVSITRFVMEQCS